MTTTTLNKSGLEPGLSPFSIADRTFTSRLFVGTGKYGSYELMQQSLDASGCEVVTVAVRRERLVNEKGEQVGIVQREL